MLLGSTAVVGHLHNFLFMLREFLVSLNNLLFISYRISVRNRYSSPTSFKSGFPLARE